MKNRSLYFIVLLGIVSLFADITYEGARSIVGPYLSLLGASGAVVGIVVGFSEFVGSGFRIVSGLLSDKTQKYWLITFLGYAINLLAVPLLALAGSWQSAAFLVILERFGKAIRVPARDAMLSYATKDVGRGFGFGLHEALDQVGAIVGPLFITAVLFFKEGFRFGFACLLIPALLALITLVIAQRIFPRPQEMEPEKHTIQTKGFSQTYWLYLLAVGLVGAGYVDFALIAYHFQKTSVLAPVWIPFFYSIAMAVDGLVALIIGRLFDKKGISALIWATCIAAFFAPCVFFGNFYGALFGIVLWGIGMGAQESIMRAVIALLVPSTKRGSAYGILNFTFGAFWAIGSAIIGVCYDVSIPLLVGFSVFAQLSSLPFFLMVRHHM